MFVRTVRTFLVVSLLSCVLVGPGYGGTDNGKGNNGQNHGHGNGGDPPAAPELNPSLAGVGLLGVGALMLNERRRLNKR
jgi:hypothetical protein